MLLSQAHSRGRPLKLKSSVVPGGKVNFTNSNINRISSSDSVLDEAVITAHFILSNLLKAVILHLLLGHCCLESISPESQSRCVTARKGLEPGPEWACEPSAMQSPNTRRSVTRRNTARDRKRKEDKNPAGLRALRHAASQHQAIGHTAKYCQGQREKRQESRKL